MATAPLIALDVATSADAPLLGNLLELYAHDLSAAFPEVALGPDGRFGYPQLPRYWSEPERRFAFLIRCDSHVAGFVLATRESPGADVAARYDVAEFFVLRRYRRAGVGRRAAAMLWDRLPGRWTVRVAEPNRDAHVFWRRVVAAATGGQVPAVLRSRESVVWHVYTFVPQLAHPAG